LFFTASLYAQVTIGSETAPEPSVLLQIKEYETVSGSGAATAERGILLPRVNLNSLSDITVITGGTPNEIVNLTGLLVYNVNTSIGEGIYEWNGQEWAPLEVFSKEESTETKKSLVQASTLSESNVPTVDIGRFEFRFSPDEKAQCRIKTLTAASESIGSHVGRFWDKISGGYILGFTYDSKVFTFTSSSNWQNFSDTAIRDSERMEIWLADNSINKIYNVQFIVYKKVAIPTYIVLVTEY
jgi:hypothetical protein